MAKRQFVKIDIKPGLSNNIEDFQNFYTVETPIGAGQKNSRLADIELVQFFLKHFFQDPIHVSQTPPTSKGLKKILIDGVVGKQTTDAILFFQNWQRKVANLTVVDRIVSVPASNVAIIGRHMATMWKLNWWFIKFSPLKERFGRLEDLLVAEGAFNARAEISRFN